MSQGSIEDATKAAKPTSSRPTPSPSCGNSLDEMCMATPAIAGDRLLIRTLTMLYCFREAK